MVHQPQRIAFDEFASRLEEIFERVRDRDQAVLVEREGDIFRIEKDVPEDVWSDYDPERVQKAIVASAGILKGVDIDSLIEEINAQREQGPARFE